MGKIFHAARSLSQSARVRVGVPAGIAFALVGYMTSGYQYWGWLSLNWEWVVGWVRSPYFYWGVGAALLGLIASGIRSAIKAEVRTVERETAVRKDVLEIPIMLAKAHAIRLDLNEFQRGLDRLKDWFQAYISNHRFLGDEIVPLGSRDDKMLQIQHDVGNHLWFVQKDYYSFTVPRWTPPWNKVEAHYRVTQKENFGPKQYAFDPNSNRAAQAAENENRRIVRECIKELEAFGHEQGSAAKELEHAAARRLASYEF